MKDDDFWATVEPAEDRYGGGYRTGHVILKRRHASLALSAYSCRLHDKIAPNRDYTAEGLCAFIGGESWKFIDAIAVGLKEDGARLELKPAKVRASPWECEYTYSAGPAKLTVSYYLYNSPPGGSGVMKARAEGVGRNVSIVFEPFFAIAPAGSSENKSMEAGISDGALCVSAGGAAACARLEGGELREAGYEVKWKYKLGRGDRAKVDGRIRPVPETGRISSFYELEAKGCEADLRFSCGASRKAAMSLLGSFSTGPQEDLVLARSIREAVLPGYRGSDTEKAVVWRALGMAGFGVEFEGVRCIEAGGLLSREIRSRDQFEGLLQNFQAVKRMHGLECVKGILLKAYGLQDRWGRLPGCFSRAPGHADASATLTAFILAGFLVRDTCDGDFAIRSAEAFRKFFDGACACEVMPDGPPVVKPNGLIGTVPEGEFGYRTVDGQRVPCRMSPAWARELASRGEAEDLRLQRYLLPEVNARWVRCLEAGWLFSKYTRDFRLADRCKMFYYRALDAYKKIFYDRGAGFIYNMVTTDESWLGRRSDPAIGSAGVEAAAILGTDVFNVAELTAIARIAKRRLLRKKWGLPFGIATMDGAECVYLDARGEHGGAVRPADTPYLLRLLRMAGDDATADRILEASLRHQMEEGFIFYNSGLFSCDHGLVPSGEPVSWLSQWVDPYLEKK